MGTSEAPTEQPHVEESRLLAAAADQMGAAVRRDRLLAQAAELEIARRSDELKSALVDSVSHDLRTPLATIRAAAGSLADPTIDLPADERRAIAAAIDAEAARLNLLVGDLLDMSRIQGGALVPDIEVIPLAELVGPAVERASAAVDNRPIQVDLPDDLPEVQADAALLDQVVSNLLDNAVKYAGDDAPIRLTAEALADDRVSLTVEDGGPGVPDNALATIFERFARIDRPEDRARRGFGLGLAVVRGLVEAMGGSVRAARSEMGGLAVTVTLPAHAAADGLVTADGAPRLLLVEDDHATRGALATNLRGHDYRVTEAADGEEALRSWEQGRPDLILLDLGLPGIDGLSVVQRVRRDATTPIIVLSARDQERDKVAALDAGADDYLTKPFGMEELHARVRAALRRALAPAAAPDGRVLLGPLALDPARRRVAVAEREVHLTPREYELLKTLLANTGRVVGRGRLLRAVWGTDYVHEGHYLHVHVAAIRRKLAAADETGVLRGLIVAEPGVGYRVRDAEELGIAAGS